MSLLIGNQKQHWLTTGTRMGLSLLLVVIAFYFSSIVKAIGRPDVSTSSENNSFAFFSPLEDVPLKLTTTIVDQSYCDTGSLRLGLRLRYTNVSDHQVILYRYSKVIFGYMVSKDLENASAGKHETDALQYAVVYGKNQIDTPSPNESFIILKPHDCHETDAVLYLVLRKEPDDSVTVPAGKHYLQIRARTWTSSPDLALALRSRWQEFGELWSRPITSEPMQFVVDNTQSAVKCLD